MSKTQRNVFQRIVAIAHEHIVFARRNPSKLTEIAGQMGMSEDATLAAAIADQVVEEFHITPKRGAPCLKL